MNRDRLELANEKRPVSTNGVVLRHDTLEGARDIRGEDDMDDVLAVRVAGRRDGLDDGDGTLEWDFDSLGEEPRLLPELALKRMNQTLSDTHSSTRQQPNVTVALLVAQEQYAPLPAQNRGDANTRFQFRPQLDDEPNPCIPRSLETSSSTSTSRTDATGAMTS
jgi:hypothetical protein